MAKNLILCGFMGSGKTTIGRRLSALTGREFIDLDQYIEEKAGMTITEIFAHFEESGFRERETDAVRSLSERDGLIVAAGGGTLLFPQNVRLFRENGVIVLLDAPLPALQERLKNDRARPLLQKPNRREIIREMHEKRMPAYREAADLSVDAGAPAAAVARRVLDSAEELCGWKNAEKIAKG